MPPYPMETIHALTLTLATLAHTSVSLPAGSAETIAGGVMTTESVTAVPTFVNAIGPPVSAWALQAATGTGVARRTQAGAAHRVAVPVGAPLGAHEGAAASVFSWTRGIFT